MRTRTIIPSRRVKIGSSDPKEVQAIKTSRALAHEQFENSKLKTAMMAVQLKEPSLEEDVLVKCGSHWVRCQYSIVKGAEYANYKRI